MRNVFLLFLSFFFVAGCAAARVSNEQPACLVALCVGDRKASEAIVVKRLGPGKRVGRSDDVGQSRCYFDTTTGLWAEFTFAGKEESKRQELRGIMLTEQQMCDRAAVARRALGNRLVGVQIGMSESEVVALRGKPARYDDAKEREAKQPHMSETRYSAKFGELVLVYEKPDELGFTFIYLKGDRVRTIWYSASE